MQNGFSAQQYQMLEKRAILQRIKKFSKLYLEIGGKLLYDDHAARVLPGYDPQVKIKLIRSLMPCDLLYCVNARDIESHRRIGSSETSCAIQALKEIKKLKRKGINIAACVITRFAKQREAKKFKKKVEKYCPVYTHTNVPKYLESAQGAIAGLAKQPYVPVSNKLCIVTGVASGSGKMAVALSQIFHERKQEINAGFAKVETFPIWNLPVAHPINRAYEAATADLQDKVILDTYHWKAYHKKASNYNRDIKNFALLQKLLKSITHERYPFGYRSPTDMGINMAKKGITNEKVCIEAANEEIIRRYYEYLENFKKGKEKSSTINRMKEIIRAAHLPIPS
ncbi:MAG TPA: DUF1846 domain-containing protein [Candidatus Nanoarchaeia archaeon]|nr:DUF1846 domain-containing protein [Candidatus Nanoarchaeia archaeon]